QDRREPPHLCGGGLLQRSGSEASTSTGALALAGAGAKAHFQEEEPLRWTEVQFPMLKQRAPSLLTDLFRSLFSRALIQGTALSTGKPSILIWTDTGVTPGLARTFVLCEAENTGHSFQSGNSSILRSCTLKVAAIQ